MSSDPRDFHLPDLPNAGYSTQRQKELSDAIMEFMRQTERNRFLLLTIVIDGRQRWRQTARKVWGQGCDDTALDAIYDYFTLQACRPIIQRKLLHAKNNPPKWREIVRNEMPAIEQQREQVRLMDRWS